MRGIFVEVWGDYGLFTRPEMKAERVSYDVLTPSAARGILEAIYWHPGMRWIIDEIWVMNPIEFTNIRRNEVAGKGSRNINYISAADKRQQRAVLLLKNVRYRIKAHFELTENRAKNDSEDKFFAIIMRRLQKGQCFHQPYLGTREFPANFKLAEAEKLPQCFAGTEIDLGYMLYDLAYGEEILPMFFRAKMKNGVIDLRNCEVVK